MWDRNRVDLVDVSTFQPEEQNGHRLIDWPKAIARGVKAVVARVSYIEGGEFKLDPAFPDHARRVRDAGLELAGYHYFGATHDARDQARRFIDALGLAATLAPAGDFEASSGKSPAELADAAEAFLDELDGLTGRRALFYSFPGFVTASLRAEAARFFSRLLWNAHYSVAEPEVPAPWWEASIWQSQGNDGRLDGFPGAVDRSSLRDDVTLEHLRTGIGPRFAPDLDTVRGQQSALRMLGIDVGPYVDGQRGARTAFAVAAFQKRAGLVPDGVVGTQTRAALAEALENVSQPG